MPADVWFEEEEEQQQQVGGAVDLGDPTSWASGFNGISFCIFWGYEILSSSVERSKMIPHSIMLQFMRFGNAGDWYNRTIFITVFMETIMEPFRSSWRQSSNSPFLTFTSSEEHHYM